MNLASLTSFIRCEVQSGGTRALSFGARRLRSAAAVFVCTMREIFDESAYARFLSRSQMAPSREAYASFRRENELSKARRPKCC